MKIFFITFLSLLTLLGTATPTLVFAKQTERGAETKYSEAYVPCGTEDKTRKVPIIDETTKRIKRFETQNATTKVSDGKGGETTIEGDGIIDNPCQFSDIIVLAKKLMTGWIVAGVTFATMGFSYAGLLYITAMGSSEKISHAHQIFVKTFWGFVFMLSAWLIVYAMESVFLSDRAKCNSFLTTPETREALGCDRYK